jgi:hypothetical protein
MGRARGRTQSARDLVRLLPVYLALGVLKRVVSIPSLARHVWRESRGVRDPAREQRLVANVVRLSHWSRRTDRDCLQRSLLLYRELSRAGADPRLWVGFRRSSLGVEGHAWVSIDGRVITEANPDDHGFEASLSFGRHGEPVPVQSGVRPRADSPAEDATAR